MRSLALLFILLLSSCATTKKTDSLPELKPRDNGYVAVNGIEMYYEIYGKGEPLVLLHGGGSSIHVNFGRGIPELAKHYQVIAFDELGHGRTKYFDRVFGFAQTADDIAAALKKLKIENANFMGFSNGAMTGMHLAIRHPGLFKKMILSSGLYQRDGAPPEFWKSMNGATLENMPQDLKDAYLKTAIEPANLEKMFQLDSKRMQNFAGIPDKDIKKINIPVLLIHNYQDVASPESALKTMRLLPKGQLAILPGFHDNFLGSVGEPHEDLKNASLTIIFNFLKN